MRVIFTKDLKDNKEVELCTELINVSVMVINRMLNMSMTKYMKQ